MMETGEYQNKRSLAAVKLQSTWRGKLTRRAIKRRNVGAIHIQRVVRGMLCRMHYSQILVKRRANVSQQKEHVKRMRDIASKELDLKVLRKISPEMYIHFEKLKKANSAKIIQRMWLKKKEKCPTDNFDRKDSVQNDKFNPNHLKLREFLQLSGNIRTILDRTCTENVESESGNPLGLSQLFQRIKTDCQRKHQTVGMKRSAGTRHKYKDLLEMQQKARVYLQEYDELRPHFTSSKSERSVIMKRLRDHQSFFSMLEGLDNFEDVVSSEKGHYILSRDEEFMNKIDESIDNHLVALETFSSDRWDTLYVPLIGKASVVQSRKRKEYNSIEESLLWVTYAGALTVETKPLQLQKDIVVHLRNPTRVVDAFVEKFEEETVNTKKLSSLVQDSLWRELREKFKMATDSSKKNSNKLARMRAVLVIQSAIRGYLARKAAAIIRDQKKMYAAVHAFVKEISSLKHVDDAKALQFFLQHESIAKSFKEDSKSNVPTIRSQMKVSQNCAKTIDSSPKLYNRATNANVEERDRTNTEIGGKFSNIKPLTKDDEPVPSSSKRVWKGKVDFAQEKISSPASHLDPLQTTPRTRSVGSTPMGRSNSVSKSSTPKVVADSFEGGEDFSVLLSPFLEMPLESDGPQDGYISPPSQSHTLSRSLSASFGQALNAEFGENGEIDFFESVLQKYENHNCSVEKLVDCALIADEKEFDQDAAFNWMYQFTLFVDAGSLLRWLLSKSDEMDVEQVATIFLQMWLEVKGNISDHDSQLFNNFCTMLRFMAAGQPSGKVSIPHLHKSFLQLRKK